ncbi:alpha/beta hydrolase [Streptomyces phaeochromogenes]|uniref:alpha/beta hydrolase n=1 Tax=Streptomyces phaeochromogenes TaxID=1923 RepID=UPI002DD85D8B|nr:alpha/beta hydrolase [Streptomyces phaeochromogenes]WRZ26855.1 alpha/beta hydrolase [Streptomyces phaeochromogenes]
MRTDVTFPSAGLKLAGHLYTPGVNPGDSPGGSPVGSPGDTSSGEAAGPRPAIVVGHPGSGVKEQAAGLYARRLAERGFVTLAYDAAFQGESEGTPRGLEDPAHRVEDIKAAVSYLATREEVDADRIGALGICASGGYVLSAAATDHRVKAVGTVSAADIARQFRLGADGAQDPAVIQGMLDAAANARTAEALGEGVQSFQLFPDTAEQALAMGGRHAVDGFEYYCTDRAQHPRSAKFLTWSSVDRMVAFDAFGFVDLISPRPLLMIVGREAVTSWMSVEAFQKARGPKELHWIDGARHVDLYDKDEYVTPAIAELAGFFHTRLASTSRSDARPGDRTRPTPTPAQTGA